MLIHRDGTKAEITWEPKPNLNLAEKWTKTSLRLGNRWAAIYTKSDAKRGHLFMGGRWYWLTGAQARAITKSKATVQIVRIVRMNKATAPIAPAALPEGRLADVPLPEAGVAEAIPAEPVR